MVVASRVTFTRLTRLPIYGATFCRTPKPWGNFKIDLIRNFSHGKCATQIMSGHSMEAPYSIASIPRPIDDTNGRAYASPIFGVRDSRKRKRHEVVVGVDGESVNLYSVNNALDACTVATDLVSRSNLNEISPLTPCLRKHTSATRQYHFMCEEQPTRRLGE
jgi:hypothetical protein